MSAGISNWARSFFVADAGWRGGGAAGRWGGGGGGAVLCFVGVEQDPGLSPEMLVAHFPPSHDNQTHLQPRNVPGEGGSPPVENHRSHSTASHALSELLLLSHSVPVLTTTQGHRICVSTTNNKVFLTPGVTYSALLPRLCVV